jgi:hypothetical protein
LEIKLIDEQPASTIYTIFIEVKNLPPFYVAASKPENQLVMINSFLYQDIPSFQDPEGCPL